MLDATDLHRERDALHAHGGNLMRMLEGCRAKGRAGNSGFTSSVVRMTADAYRNALEAALATVDEVETECLIICHQRESGNSAFDLSQRLPSPRPTTALPAVGSFAAE